MAARPPVPTPGVGGVTSVGSTVSLLARSSTPTSASSRDLAHTDSFVYGSSQRRAVVLEFGARFVRAGLAAEWAPRVTLDAPACLDYTQLGAARPSREDFVARLDGFVSRILLRELQVKPAERRVVVVERVLMPAPLREAIGVALLEGASPVMSVHFVAAPVTALLSTGVRTGLVVDVGYRHTSCTAVFDGICLPYTHQYAEVGAVDVGKGLLRALDARDAEFAASLANLRRLTRPFLEDVVARCCFVAAGCGGGGASGDASGTGAVASGAGVGAGAGASGGAQPVDDTPSGDVRTGTDAGGITYTAQGDTPIQIPGFSRSKAFDAFFPERGPSCIAECVIQCLLKCDVDTRAHLSSIVVVGGISACPGFARRVHDEVVSEIASEEADPRWQTLRPLLPRLRLRASPTPASVAVWCGGAVIGALESLEKVSVTRVNGAFVSAAAESGDRRPRPLRHRPRRVAELAGVGRRVAGGSGSDTEATSDGESVRSATQRWAPGIGDWTQVATPTAAANE